MTPAKKTPKKERLRRAKKTIRSWVELDTDHPEQTEAQAQAKRTHAEVRAKAKTKLQASDFLISEADEFRYFTPSTWFFWRGVIINFCIFCLVGHWLEIPYCMFMDWAFHVVADDYDVWTAPLWVPYWVYGFGSVIITLVLYPLKIHILEQRKSLIGAVVQFFIAAVAICALLELVIGLMINQPDATGKYPFWDNSILPLNIFGQAWLVNDAILGLVASFYVFIIFPFTQRAFSLLKPRTNNRIFVFTVVFFLIVCVLSYAVPLFPDLYNALT